MALDLNKYRLRRLKRPRCPAGRRFSPVYSDHRLSGAFLCVAPEKLQPGGECEIRVVAFQRDPRTDPVKVRVKLHGNDRLYWPDRKKPSDVSRTFTLDLAETSDDIDSAKSYGLGSWGSFAAVRMISLHKDGPTAVLQSRISVKVTIGVEALPRIAAYAEIDY